MKKKRRHTSQIYMYCCEFYYLHKFSIASCPPFLRILYAMQEL